MGIQTNALIVAAGGVAAAGVFGLNLLRGPSDTGVAQDAAAPDASMVCLHRDLDFLPGDQTGCFNAGELRQMEAAALVDHERGDLSVSLTHPSDASVGAKQCRSCREFRELRYDGWYAMTSRDMRREAFFVRACGALSLLKRAGEAAHDHVSVAFADAAAITDLARQLVDDIPDAPAISAEDLGSHRWRVTAGDQIIYLESIAVADFDDDAYAENLVFIHLGPDGGTARMAEIALIDKDGADAPAAISMIDFVEQFVENKGS